MIDCPSPIDDHQANDILASYSAFPELTRDLRFWMSNLHIGALTTPEDRRDALQLKAQVESELRR